jgi:hypothetical protein
MHLLPVTAFDPAVSVDISNRGGRDRDLSTDLSCWAVGGHFNFDGYLLKCYNNDNREALAAYVQVFRHGAIETGKVLSARVKYIDNDVEASIIRGTKALLNIQKELGIEPPVFVALSFLEVKECPVMLPPHAQGSGLGRKIDRDFLLLPECMLEGFEIPVERMLRPAFDALYQSSGMPRSFNYDESGNWIGQKID